MSDDLSRYYGHSTDRFLGGGPHRVARGFYVVPYREHFDGNGRPFPGPGVQEMLGDMKWAAAMVEGANDDGGR